MKAIRHVIRQTFARVILSCPIITHSFVMIIYDYTALCPCKHPENTNYI